MIGTPVRVALVANPASGSDDAGTRVTEALRGLGGIVERLALGELGRVSADRHDRLIVAGGDGSVAPAAVRAGQVGIPLGVVPVGTANDFARAFDLPADVVPAARLALRGGEVRRLDLGRAGTRPFVNAASAGLNVPAARAARRLKGALGPAAYAVGAARAAAAAPPVEVSVDCDGRRLFAGAAWQVIVADSGAFGAGAEVGPAVPDDGLLDVVVIRAGPRPRLARHAYGLRRGHLVRQPGVLWARAAVVSLAQRGPGAAALNVDGELVEAPWEEAFRVEPRAFALVVGGAPGR